jgi:hypothetical protein
MSSIILGDFKPIFKDNFKQLSNGNLIKDIEHISTIANISFLQWFNKNIILNPLVTIKPEEKKAENSNCPECSQPLTNGRCHKCDQAGV